MRFVTFFDNHLMSWMDEIGFYLQTRWRIQRYYLVLILQALAFPMTFLKGLDDVHDPRDIGIALGVFGTMAASQMFYIHRQGAKTPIAVVNTCVEGIRQSPLYITMRMACFVMFMMVSILNLLTVPWHLALSFIEYFFMFYPVTIYQHEIPPRTERSAKEGSVSTGGGNTLKMLTSVLEEPPRPSTERNTAVRPEVEREMEDVG